MSRNYNIFSRVPNLWKIKFILVLSILALLIPSLGGTAFAYNRNNAVSYADQWALSRNGNYPSYGADCTNFASQALNAGGYSQVNLDNNTSNLDNWYSYWFLGHFIASYSWYNAPDHYQFQWYHVPGGYFQASVSNAATNAAYFAHYDAANMVGGDELFYSWTGNGVIDHMAFQVWSGWSQYMPAHETWYGDLSDQHVTDRYHVSWNHIEVNAQWPTTVIYEMHIGDGN
jgi:hypothetical protein